MNYNQDIFRIDKAFCRMCRKSDIAGLQSLVSQHPNCFSYRGVMVACNKGNVEVIETLNQLFPNKLIEYNFTRSMIRSCIRGNVQMVKYTIEKWPQSFDIERLAEKAEMFHLGCLDIILGEYPTFLENCIDQWENFSKIIVRICKTKHFSLIEKITLFYAPKLANSKPRVFSNLLKMLLIDNIDSELVWNLDKMVPIGPITEHLTRMMINILPYDQNLIEKVYIKIAHLLDDRSHAHLFHAAALSDSKLILDNFATKPEWKINPFWYDYVFKEFIYYNKIDSSYCTRPFRVKDAVIVKYIDRFHSYIDRECIQTLFDIMTRVNKYSSWRGPNGIEVIAAILSHVTFGINLSTVPIGILIAVFENSDLARLNNILLQYGISIPKGVILKAVINTWENNTRWNVNSYLIKNSIHNYDSVLILEYVLNKMMYSSPLVLTDSATNYLGITEESKWSLILITYCVLLFDPKYKEILLKIDKNLLVRTLGDQIFAKVWAFISN